MNKRNKEYYKNTVILFIGKFVTQFMSIILLPLFTRYLLTEDYGYVDLIQTYLSLFVPILTLRMDSAVFRFLIDARKDEEKKAKIITNSTFLTFLGIAIISIIYVILKIFFNVKYLTYMYLNIVILSISNVIFQVIRGLGKIEKYSIACSITGVSNLIVNLVLLLGFNCNASCILISSIISNLLAIAYIVYETKLLFFIKLKNYDKKIIKNMLKFSIPMIPNSLSWWVINVSDRSIITAILGVALNGIYTISCKFSNILNSIFTIFNMSWTEMTALHIDDDDKDIFFNEMINKLLFFFSSIGLFIISILPIFYNILIGKNYFSSYYYIPILMLSNIGNVLSWLCGGIYVAKKKTKSVANTTIISAIINLVLDLILIKFIGLYAACISTFVSYLYLSIYRCYDCQKYVKFKINLKKIIIIMISYLFVTLFYYCKITWLNIISLVYTILISLYINKNFIIEIKTIISEKIKGFRKKQIYY